MFNSLRNRKASLGTSLMRVFSKLRIFKSCSKWHKKATMRPEFLFMPYSKKFPIFSRNIMSTSWLIKSWKVRLILRSMRILIFFTNCQSFQTISRQRKWWNSLKNWFWLMIFPKKLITMRSKNTLIWWRKTMKWKRIESKFWRICL